MSFKDLREFISLLEQEGELKRITAQVDPNLEITEIADRCLRNGGPALLFENPKGSSFPAANLFGNTKRIALAMGQRIWRVCATLADCWRFEGTLAPKGWRDLWQSLPSYKNVLNMPPAVRKTAPCQEVVIAEEDVDIGFLPIQTCWPGDAGPLVTWPLVITRGPEKDRQNLGIYRMQKLGPNKLIMRWLSHRGGALDFKEWQEKLPGEGFPVSIAIGADPATVLATVTPVPDTLSEYAFAGLLRNSKTEVVKSLTNDLQVPANAEIVLEGVIEADEMADEGPYGDHTGYYNEVERFPVFTIKRITHRRGPYLSQHLYWQTAR